MGSVLIITNTCDTHADCLIEKFRARNKEFFRLNTDEYPSLLGLDYMVGNSETCLSLGYGDKRLDSIDVSTIWFRRPLKYSVDRTLPEQAQRFANDECKAVFESLYLLFPNALWVSHPAAIRKCQQKLWQLKEAVRIGFQVPDTLVTSNPVSFKTFWDKHSGEVIYKPMGRNMTFDREGNIRFAYTNKLDSNFLNNLEGIQAAPCLFQEYIPKESELRISVVGENVFACEIDSQKSEKTMVDWRHYDLENTPHRQVELPPSIAAQCKMLLKHFGLEFGAIDLVKTPDGQYVFLEINPNGQWLWIEQLTGMPISEAIYDLLAK